MKLLQVDAKGETVADLGPPVPDDEQTATLGGNMVVAQGAHVPPLRPAARPSMSVETTNRARPILRRVNNAQYSLYLGDCLTWMDERASNSIEAIVTDPP